MAKTMIRIQPCKIGSSDAHNRRTKYLDYVRQDLSHLNEHWSADPRTLPEIRSELANICKLKTGRTMQAKATPIREGVVLIRKDTTLTDLKRFTDECERRWGIKAIRISTHLDEGHLNTEGVWVPNRHAHIVFEWMERATGKSCKLSKNNMIEMQTLLANELGMERGVSSDTRHLNAVQYKLQTSAESLNSTLKMTNIAVQAQRAIKLEKEQLVNELEKAKDQVKRENEELEYIRRQNQIQSENYRLDQKKATALKYHLQELNDAIGTQRAQNEEIIKALEYGKDDLKSLENELENIKKDYQSDIANIPSINPHVINTPVDYDLLRQCMPDIQDQEQIIADAKYLGLPNDAIIWVNSGKPLSFKKGAFVRGIQLPEPAPIATKNTSDGHRRLVIQFQNMWYNVVEFMEQVLKHLGKKEVEQRVQKTKAKLPIRKRGMHL